MHCDVMVVERVTVNRRMGKKGEVVEKDISLSVSSTLI